MAHVAPIALALYCATALAITQPLWAHKTTAITRLGKFQRGMQQFWSHSRLIPTVATIEAWQQTFYQHARVPTPTAPYRAHSRHSMRRLEP